VLYGLLFVLHSNKRPTFAPVTFDSNGAAAKKVAKDDQKIYAPPSGKFSEKAGSYEGWRCVLGCSFLSHWYTVKDHLVGILYPEDNFICEMIMMIFFVCNNCSRYVRLQTCDASYLLWLAAFLWSNFCVNASALCRRDEDDLLHVVRRRPRARSLAVQPGSTWSWWPWLPTILTSLTAIICGISTDCSGDKWPMNVRWQQLHWHLELLSTTA